MRPPTSRLRVSVLEVSAGCGHPGEVLEAVEFDLAAAEEGELVLLPEACLTGYVSAKGDFDLSPFAEPQDGPTARALAELAARRRLHLVGPLIEQDQGHCFNAVVGFDPGGRRFLHYRKRHPWYPEAWATPGAEPHPVVTVAGLRVTVAICFDVHFLIEEAGEALCAADLLLFPSSWVEEVDSRPALLGDLARRFSVAVANANWGPGVVRVAGQGGSRVLDREGRVLAATGHGERLASARIGPGRP